MKKKEDIDRELLYPGLCTFIAIVAILFLGAIMMLSGCGHIGLPDRSKCVVPWEERKTCVADADCAPDQVCAFRGRTVGKCTLVDCCDPWRNKRMESGKNWCSQEETTSTPQQ